MKLSIFGQDFVFFSNFFFQNRQSNFIQSRKKKEILAKNKIKKWPIMELKKANLSVISIIRRNFFFFKFDY